MNEPSLNPPIDHRLEQISEMVDNFNIKDLASEIFDKGLSEKVKETILEVEIPNCNDFMREMVESSNLDFLLKLVSKKTLSEVREILIDYLYWKDQSWAS
jgi:hypothetical protein